MSANASNDSEGQAVGSDITTDQPMPLAGAAATTPSSTVTVAPEAMSGVVTKGDTGASEVSIW